MNFNTFFRALCSAFLFVPTVSFAGLFGPSNYDECVLDGIKDAKTETAAQMVARACRNKFPIKSEPTQQRTWFDIGFYKLGTTGLRNQLADKLSVVDNSFGTDVYGNRVTKIRLMNGYSFPVHNISVGLIPKGDKSKSCPTNVSGFSEIAQCTGSAEGFRSGTFICPRINVAFCITGFYADQGYATEKEAKKSLASEMGEP